LCVFLCIRGYLHCVLDREWTNFSPTHSRRASCAYASYGSTFDCVCAFVCVHVCVLVCVCACVCISGNLHCVLDREWTNFSPTHSRRASCAYASYGSTFDCVCVCVCLCACVCTCVCVFFCVLVATCTVLDRNNRTGTDKQAMPKQALVACMCVNCCCNGQMCECDR